MDSIINNPQSERVGIVILNWNKAQDILECIKSIYMQDYKCLTIIVVDNNSSDTSCELIKSNFPEVCLIENKINSGVAGGRNIGIKYLKEQQVKTEFILFLDNDITLKENCIEEMVNSLKGVPDIGIVAPKLLRPNGILEYAGGIDLRLTTGRIINIGSGQKDSGQYDYYSESLDSSGGIFMIRREVLDEVGSFDEGFNPYGWEDVDMSLRVKKKGYHIFYNYKALMYHSGGKSIRGFNKDYELSKIRNYFYLIKKHSNSFQLIVFYILLPLRLLLSTIRQIQNGEYKFILPQLNGFLSTIFGRFR